jgi:hypothetical protein
VNELSQDQISQAAIEIIEEIAPVLNQFPLGVGLEVGARLVEQAIGGLCTIRAHEDALGVVSALEEKLIMMREAINGHEAGLVSSERFAEGPPAAS